MKFKHITSEKTLKGIVKRHPDGFGFVIPDDKNHQDIYIPASRMGSALTYDRVEALVQKRRHRQMFFGSIKTILKRHWEWTAGPYEIESGKSLLKKHSLPIDRPIEVQNPRELTIKKEEWVKVKLTAYPTEQNPLFQGDILENLGVITSSAKDDNSKILAENNIPIKFPKPVLEELKTLPDEVRPEDWKERKDLTNKAFVTIDGITAKDFDDAIFVEKHSFGFRLFVAIADVSHYVQENSQLDREAYSRGNSTYLPDLAVSMLPEKLSNGLCSLNPQVPRLAMVAEMDFDVQGIQLKYQFYPAVIKSHHRLTYGQAQDIFDDSDKDKKWVFLKDAAQLGQILIQRQDQNGVLDFNIPEITVKVNSQGEPVEIIKEMRLFSHKLIEQFMLAANQAVSLFLKEKKSPSLYRIHESPEKESLKQLENFSKSLSFSSPLNTRQNLLAFLKKFKGHSSEPLINKLTLRALSQARYSAFNKGHYGLNFSAYTHFTSPIRRYCDLTIHRLIRQALNHSQQKALPSDKTLEKQARWISEREQISVKAERKVVDIKKARFLKPHIGEEFDGVISSITSFGLFIALGKFDVEGLVRFRDLPGHWIFDEANLRAESKRSRYSMQFGDAVRIKVITANTETGTIDFKLISHKNIKTPEVSKTSGKKKTLSREKKRGRHYNRSRSRHYDKKQSEEDTLDSEKPAYKGKRKFKSNKYSDQKNQSRTRLQSKKQSEKDTPDFEKSTYKGKRNLKSNKYSDQKNQSRTRLQSKKQSEKDTPDFEKSTYKGKRNLKSNKYSDQKNHSRPSLRNRKQSEEETPKFEKSTYKGKRNLKSNKYSDQKNHSRPPLRNRKQSEEETPKFEKSTYKGKRNLKSNKYSDQKNHSRPPLRNRKQSEEETPKFEKSTYKGKRNLKSNKYSDQKNHSRPPLRNRKQSEEETPKFEKSTYKGKRKFKSNKYSDQKNQSRTRLQSKKQSEKDTPDFEKSTYKGKRNLKSNKYSDQKNHSRPPLRNRKQSEEETPKFEKSTYKGKRNLKSNKYSDQKNHSRPPLRNRKQSEEETPKFEKSTYKGKRNLKSNKYSDQKNHSQPPRSNKRKKGQSASQNKSWPGKRKQRSP